VWFYSLDANRRPAVIKRPGRPDEAFPASRRALRAGRCDERILKHAAAIQAALGRS
jgi:hypothetical protein